jgi:hypothetical protein
MATMNLQVFRCADCGAQVVRAQTTSGHYMWIDADPSPEGTIAITSDGLARVVSPQVSRQLRHRPHRATCNHQRRETP